MDISLLFLVLATLILLISGGAAFFLFRVVRTLDQQISAEQCQEMLENVVTEVKDHFEIHINNMLQNSEIAREVIEDNNAKVERLLGLHEAAVSELASGHSRMQDGLADFQRRLQQAMEKSTEQISRSIVASTDSQQDMVAKLAASYRGFFESASNQFSAINRDLLALKKAAATLINSDRSSHERGLEHQQLLEQALQQLEQLQNVPTLSGSDLENALKPLRHGLEMVEKRPQLGQADIDKALSSVYRHQDDQTAMLKLLADRPAVSVSDLNRAIEPVTVKLVDQQDAMRSSFQLQQNLLNKLVESGDKATGGVDQLLTNRLDMNAFLIHHNQLAEAMTDLTAVMQPLMDPNNQALTVQDLEPQRHLLEQVQQHTAELQQQLQQMSDNLQQSIDTQRDQLVGSLDAAQTTIYTELDSVRMEQVDINRRTADMQRLLGLLRLQNNQRHLSEILQGDQLVIETPENVQHLSGCVLERVEDKQTGEETRFYYEQGRQVSSETSLNGLVKYRVWFNEQGQPSHSSEYDVNGDGRELVRYFYDDNGDICRRTELQYDASGMQTGAVDIEMTA